MASYDFDDTELLCRVKSPNGTDHEVKVSNAGAVGTNTAPPGTSALALLEKTTGVDMKTTGNKDIYVPASGKVGYVTMVLLVPNTIDTATVEPAAWVEVSSARDVFDGQTLSGFTTDDQYAFFGGSGLAPIARRKADGTAGEKVKLNVSVGATATTFTVDVYVYGVEI